MKYKSSSKKWTKKFKAAFISIALGFVLAVSGALTAIGVSLNNGRGGNLADGSASSPTGSASVHTFYKGGKSPDGRTTYASNADAWSAAVAYSKAHGSQYEKTVTKANNIVLETPYTYTAFEGAKVTFKLVEDWTAQVFTGTHQAKYLQGVSVTYPEGYVQTGRVVTDTTFFDINHRRAFGNVAFNAADDSTNYVPREGFAAYGGLQIDEGANIVFDLNGHTLNRNLFNPANNLDATDPYQSWQNIVGSQNSDVAFNAKWRGENISVMGYYTTEGVSQYSTLEVIDSAVATNDIEVTGNKIANKKGGTVGKIMGGSTTSNAVNQESGGIYGTYFSTVRINGGVICNNYGYSRGAGIAMTTWAAGERESLPDNQVDYCAKLYITDGIIAQNFCTDMGGGIYLNLAYLEEFSGGKLLYNYSNDVAGGIYLAVNGLVSITLDVKRNASGNPINVNDEGPEVSYNVARSNGGGIIVRENDGIILGKCRIIGNRSVRGSGGGVFIETATSTAKFYDSPIIKDNKGVVEGQADSASNVYFSNAVNIVEVIGKLKPVYDEDGEIEPSIGVYMSTANITGAKQGIFTKDFVKYNGSRDSAANYFTCDNLSYEVSTKVNQEGQLVEAGDFANAWNRATKQSVKSGIQVNIGLNATFNAANGLFGTGYGFGFSSKDASGFMHVPASAQMNLDMSGYSINRGISGASNARDDGYVLRVDGTLVIRNTHATNTSSFLSGNNTGNGGAIYVGKGGVLTIQNNIEIAGSNAGGFGGAIYLEEGATLNITSGNIHGNNAGLDGGAIYAANGARINISGAPIIRNNTSQISFTDNIFLQDGMLLTRGGAMAAGAEVGISLENGLGQFIDSRDGILADYFKADSDIFYTVGETTEGGKNGLGLILNSDTMSQRWSNAVKRSQDNGGAPVRFDIIENWVAGANGNFASAGTTGFVDGAIYLPSNATIIITLVGGNKIDRGLTGKTAVTNGAVIINEGSLLIRGNGVITGGNNTGNGGGIINNATGKLVMQGGVVTGNTAANGAGIYGTGSFTLSNIEVKNNHANVNYGGIYTTNNVKLTVSGKLNLYGNTAGADRVASNVNADGFIVKGALTGSKIGLSLTGASKAFTSGLKAGELADVLAVFSSDTESQVVGISGGEGYIGTKTEEPEGAFTEITYDKQKHDAVLDKADIADLLNNAYTLEVKKFADEEDEVGEVVADSLELLEAGIYKLTFTLKTGYLWASEDNRAEDSITVTVKIKKATATVSALPTINGDIYVGQSIAEVQKQLRAGVADCASTGEKNIPGEWVITDTGVVQDGATSLAYKFVPDDTSIAEVSGTITISPKGFAYTVEEVPVKDGVTGAKFSFNIDYLTDVSFAFKGENIEFTVVQNGERVVVRQRISAPAGYTPYLYLAADISKKPIENGSSVLTGISASRSLKLGYKANSDTQYTIYYLMPNENGEYTEATDKTGLEDLVGTGLVYKYETTGTTDTKVTYVNSDRGPFAEFEHSDQYEFNRDKTPASEINATINGDGSTYVRIFLKGRQYTITFEPMGGNQVAGVQFSFKKSYGERIEPPVSDEQMTKSDSTFKGWYTASVGGEKVDFAATVITVEDDVTYYAQWEEQEYTITYHLDRHPDYTAYEYDIQDDYDGIKSLHFGYELGDGSISDAYFNLDLSGSENNPESYKRSTATFSIGSPSAEGFRFLGWYDANGIKVTSVKRGSRGDKELWARFQPENYLVTFDAQGGAVSPTTKTYGNYKAYGSLPVATRSGYDFKGWYVSAEDAANQELSGKVGVDSIAVLHGPITLYAGWEENNYTISYSDNGGSTPYGELKVYVIEADGSEHEAGAGEEFLYGTRVRLEVVPNSGYTVGSIRQNGVLVVNNATKTVMGDIVIEAVLNPQTYTIRYTYEGGRAINGESGFVKTYTVNSADAALPDGSAVERVGYEFTNWKLLNGTQQLATVNDIRATLEMRNEPLRNVTLVAQWNPVKLTVYLHKNMTADDSDVDAIYGDHVYTGAVVTVETEDVANYVLIGWATRPDSRTIAVPVGTDPTDEATYGKAEYTVKAERGSNPDYNTGSNHLFAVWHVEGSQELLMESDATDATYTGTAYTIKAKPYYNYSESSLPVILQYQWYKDGVPVGDRITRSSVDAGQYTDWTQVVYRVTNVSDSGVYECRLTASGDIGGTTYASGSGEIEIVIKQAEYTGMRFESGSSEYTGDLQKHYVQYQVKSAEGQIDWKNAENYIEIGSNRNDWIAVRYSYVYEDSAVEGMKNAGSYEVTAKFTMPENSNYLAIDDITSIFEIKRKGIYEVSYKMYSVGDDGKEVEVKDENGQASFINVYNTKLYRVKAESTDIFAGDEVVLGLSSNEAREVGNYEASLDGTLSGANAGNYELKATYNTTVIYRILKAEHDLSGITFEDVTVTYDGKLHELKMKVGNVAVSDGETFKDKNGYELTVRYEISVELNNSNYTSADGTDNGGISAGKYTITLSFEDADGNFAVVEDRIAVLTISQEKFFNAYDKESLLGNFKDMSLNYDPDRHDIILIDGSVTDDAGGVVMDLNDANKFGIIYTYEKLAGGSYSEVIKGDAGVISTYPGLKDSGYYRLTAEISYVDEELRNNYAEIEDVVIDYSIAAGSVKSIEVTLKADGKYWVGEGFDKSNIESIVVTYEGVNGGAESTEEFTDETWLGGSLIYDGGSGTDLLVAFDRVGEYTVRVSFLGKEQEQKVNVTQRLVKVDNWEYSEDGVTWKTLGSDGIEYSGTGYLFRAVSECVDENGNKSVAYAPATVRGEGATGDGGEYKLNASANAYTLEAGNSGYYVFEAANGDKLSGALKINKNTSVSAEWYINGKKVSETTVVYNGTDQGATVEVKYDLGDGKGEQTLSWTVQEIKNAGEYTLKAPQQTANPNYALQDIEIKLTVEAQVTNGSYKLQYKDGEGNWVTVPAAQILEYKGGEYELRIYVADGDISIPVEATLLTGNDVVAVKNAGTYELSEGLANYRLPDGTVLSHLIVQKKRLTIDWKYGEGNSFTYNGSEQELLGEVSGVGDDSDAELIDVSGNKGTRADGYKATAVLKSGYADNYELTNGSYEWSIDRLNVEITWDKTEFGYTGNPQAPAIVETNIVSDDEAKITITLKFKQGSENKDGLDVVNVGEYEALPAFGGDLDVLRNYTFNDVNCKFEIKKAAPAIRGVTYEEYATNITYVVGESEARGLREDKVVAAFNGAAVRGRFVFLKGDANGNLELDGDGEAIVISGSDIDLSEAGTYVINYRFIPEDEENYEVKEGKITVMVVADVALTGTNSLIVDLLIKQFVLGSKINVAGAEVYQKYASYYEEDGVRYGRYEEVDADGVMFTVKGYPIEGNNSYTVQESDIDPNTGVGTLDVMAIYGKCKGSAQVTTTKEIPTGMKVNESQSTFKGVWYVGETLSAKGLIFEMTYADGSKTNMSGEAMSCAEMGTKLGESDIGEKELTFEFLGLSVKIKIEIRGKEELTVVYNKTNRLGYNEGLAVDWEKCKVKYEEDGEVKDSIEGVAPKYTIRYGSAAGTIVTELTRVGTYYVQVEFAVTNPRYTNITAAVNYTIEVTDIFYTPEYESKPAKETKEEYTGGVMSIPRLTVSALKDLNGNSVSLSGVTYEYSISYNGEEASEIKNVGIYYVTVKVMYNDKELGKIEIDSYQYSYEIERAANEATVSVKSIVSGKGEVTPEVDMKFEGEVTYEYSRDGLTGWSEQKPTEVGTYYVRAHVAGTANFMEVTSEAVKFSINSAGISSEVKDEDGNTLVEIKDETNGIAPGTKLEVERIEELSGISVSKSNVLDGYKVVLKNGEAEIQPDGAVTVRLLISEELRGRTDLKVYLVDENGKATELKAELDGDYLEFSTETLGRLVICEKLSTVPVGLIVAVSIGAVVAAGLIVACVLVFLKKKRGEQ